MVGTPYLQKNKEENYTGLLVRSQISKTDSGMKNLKYESKQQQQQQQQQKPHKPCQYGILNSAKKSCNNKGEINTSISGKQKQEIHHGQTCLIRNIKEQYLDRKDDIGQKIGSTSLKKIIRKGIN